METERPTDVGTPSAEVTTANDPSLGEVLTPTSADVVDEVDAIASTIVIPDMERRAEEARASADPDAIQDVQDDYDKERRTRAERVIQRRRNKKQ